MRTLIRKAATAAALLIAFVNTIAGQTWTSLGPLSISNGDTIGVSNPVSGRVTAIAVHPSNPNLVYIGTANAGVWRTTDGGSTWTALMAGVQWPAVGAIAIDPLNPSTVFVGSGEGNLSTNSFFGGGLYIIRNADTSPTLSGPFNQNGTGSDVFTGASISSIEVSPTDDNTIFYRYGARRREHPGNETSVPTAAGAVSLDKRLVSFPNVHQDHGAAR